MKDPKYQAQAFEIEDLLKRSGMTLEELSESAGVNCATLKRIARGYQKAGAHTMQSIRHAGTIAVLTPDQLKGDPRTYNAQISKRRLRYLPVVSWATAGFATAYEDLCIDWMKRVAADSSDPRAFGIELKGDSMEPNYKEGQVVIVRPGSRAANGNLVVANLKNQGPVFKILHVKDRHTFQLSSYNKIYPIVEAKDKDFHWIYPVESVVTMLLH